MSDVKAPARRLVPRRQPTEKAPPAREGPSPQELYWRLIKSCVGQHALDSADRAGVVEKLRVWCVAVCPEMSAQKVESLADEMVLQMEAEGGILYRPAKKLAKESTPDSWAARPPKARRYNA